MSDGSFDGASEALARRLARGSSRRGLLHRIGAVLIAAPVFPLLPVSRASAQTGGGALTDFERNAQTTDPDACDYWRHCAIDGIICGC